MAVEGRLPNSNQLDSVLRDVATIATKNGLRVPKFSKNPQTQEAGTAKEQPLDVEIVGEFDGFYKFLLEVEKLPRILRLTDMKLERVQDKEQDGLVRASLKISIYYQQGQTLADLFPEEKAGQAAAEQNKSTGATSQVNGQSATASTGVNP
jgi:type IV pilus assembly protein PilO